MFTACLIFRFAVPGSCLAADAAEFSIENVSIGLDGRFKVGVWTPISCEVSGPPGAEIQPVVITADPDGLAATQPWPNVKLVDGAASVRGLFRSGRIHSPVNLEIRHAGRTVAAARIRVEGGRDARCLTQATQLWAVDGAQPPFEALVARWNQSVADGFETISIDSVLAARNAEDIENLDGVLLAAGTKISREAAEALRPFVLRGGKLVIVVGADAEPLRSGPLAEWLPCLPGTQVEVRSLSGLNELIPGSATLRMIGGLPAGELDPAQGTIVANGLTFPLILRTAYGVGTVTLVAIPLDRRPLSTWDGTASSELAARIADVAPPWKAGAVGAEGEGELSPTGVGDLQTQLLHAVDHFPQVRRSSHQTLLAWMAVLVLILGPLDYLIVHRLLKRPELTWITALIAVAAVSAMAIRGADSANAASLSAAQVELVDLDAAEGVLRSRSFFGLYSPTAARRQVGFRAVELLPPERSAATELFRSGWAGRPEEVYRGMNRRGGIDSSKPGYLLAMNRDGFDDLPTPIWSSATFGLEWERALPPATIAVADLEDGGGNRLTGTFELKLPCELTDWFIAYGDFSYTPRIRGAAGVPPLTADTVWNLRDFGSNLLRGQLVGLSTSSTPGETSVETIITVERNNYDPLSQDPASICRILSFHEAAGGEAYTGLTNHALDACDLSPLLKLNRAVLYGRLAQPTATLTVDGSTPETVRRDAFVRLVLPVRTRVRQGDGTPSRDLFEKRK